MVSLSFSCSFPFCPTYKFLLPTKSQLLDQRAISLDILTTQICEQTALSADHTKKATTGGVVLFVHLQMLGQIGDTPLQYGDLDFRRAGVPFGPRVVRDDLSFLCGFEWHKKWKPRSYRTTELEEKELLVL
jgi:hypothetical protein